MSLTQTQRRCRHLVPSSRLNRRLSSSAHNPSSLAAETDALLRDLAFVLRMTQAVKQAMQEGADAPSRN